MQNELQNISLRIFSLLPEEIPKDVEEGISQSSSEVSNKSVSFKDPKSLTQTITLSIN